MGARCRRRSASRGFRPDAYPCANGRTAKPVHRLGQGQAQSPGTCSGRTSPSVRTQSREEDCVSERSPECWVCKRGVRFRTWTA
jgi:hypothetical protein